jgi:hypothetical protein
MIADMDPLCLTGYAHIVETANLSATCNASRTNFYSLEIFHAEPLHPETHQDRSSKWVEHLVYFQQLWTCRGQLRIWRVWLGSIDLWGFRLLPIRASIYNGNCTVSFMPDPLYLSLWYPHFETIEILSRTFSVMRQFPFSKLRPGITYLAIHPVSWGEPTILEQRFHPGVAPEEAIAVAEDLLHSDYAFVFDAYWDLWFPAENQGTEWAKRSSPVKFIAHGTEFEHPEAEVGDIQVDLGLDEPFLYENLQLTPVQENLLRENVAQLVAFTAAVEKNSGSSARLLWSESEENLAQKLIARLQKVQ